MDGTAIDSGSGGVGWVAGSIGALIPPVPSARPDRPVLYLSLSATPACMGGESSDRLIIFSPDQCDGCQPHTLSKPFANAGLCCFSLVCETNFTENNLIWIL